MAQLLLQGFIPHTTLRGLSGGGSGTLAVTSLSLIVGAFL